MLSPPQGCKVTFKLLLNKLIYISGKKNFNYVILVIKDEF